MRHLVEIDIFHIPPPEGACMPIVTTVALAKRNSDRIKTISKEIKSDVTRAAIFRRLYQRAYSIVDDLKVPAYVDTGELCNQKS